MSRFTSGGLIAVPSGGALPVPAMVQHVMGGSNPSPGGTSNPGNNFEFTLPENLGANNCVILEMNATSGSVISSITDNLGNSWPTTSAVLADAGAGNMMLGVWLLLGCLSGGATITVSYTGNINNFQYDITELNNIATSGALNGTKTTGSSPISGPSLSVGSFTPGNNDANGGNLIYACFACSNITANSNPTSWVPSGGFSLLSADISWNTGEGLPHASMMLVQTTHAAINPSITATGDSADTFNCVAIALKAANAGTPRPAGMRIVAIHHFSTVNFPGSAGTYPLQAPCHGNMRYLVGMDPNNTITSVTDSESNSWTKDPTITANQHWYLFNTVINSSLIMTVHGSGPDNKQSWRFIDVIGAATTNVVDTAVNVNVSNTSGSTMNDAPTMSPSSGTGGMMIASVQLGTGPGLGFAPGAPAGAVFDLVNYTGEIDNDYMDNADLMGHAHYPAGGGTYNWNWTITNNGTNALGGAIAFKSA